MTTLSSISNDSTILFDRAMKWLCMSERDSRWIRWALVSVALLYFIFLGAAETGPINKYGHDVFVLLDGGWRTLNGQIPYRDFYLSLGPLEFMITAFGMLLTHASPQGIAIGNVVFGIIVGIWGWLLSRRRMPAIPSLLVTAWLILTATSPTPFADIPQVMSSAMIYNRHGYALLGIVLVECAFAGERSRFWGGMSSGIALVLMAFLKLNFFGVASLLLLATVPMRREEMPRAWGFLIGLAATATTFALYLRFAISAFVYDMRLTVQARSSLLRSSGYIGDILGSAASVTLAIMTVIAMLLITHGKLWQHFVVRIFLIGGVVIVTTKFFRETDQSDRGFQLATLWVIVLLGLLIAAYPQCKERVAVSSVVLLGLGCVFSVFFVNMESARFLLSYQAHSVMSRGVSVAGPGMERLKFYEADLEATSVNRFDNGHFVVDHVNDGLALLEKSSTPDESVLTIGWDNPFAYILRRKPALGGSPWEFVGDNFPSTHLLDESLVFGNADLIMVPHYPNSNEKSDAILAEAYHSYILQHFTFVDSSQWWSLYRRRK